MRASQQELLSVDESVYIPDFDGAAPEVNRNLIQKAGYLNLRKWVPPLSPIPRKRPRAPGGWGHWGETLHPCPATTASGWHRERAEPSGARAPGCSPPWRPLSAAACREVELVAFGDLKPHVPLRNHTDPAVCQAPACLPRQHVRREPSPGAQPWLGLGSLRCRPRAALGLALPAGAAPTVPQSLV